MVLVLVLVQAPRSTKNAFTDLTLPKCRAIWKQFQLAHAIKQGARGFKLDEDDCDLNIGFVDSTRFPSGPSSPLVPLSTLLYGETGY